jgi:NADP-dependent 3-hydroxy acid dehydrogenase YdfG
LADAEIIDHRAPGIEPVALDIAQTDQVAAAASRCGDIDILVNNAGIANGDEEVLADERARATRDELLKDNRAFDARMQPLWDSTRVSRD